MKIKRICTTIIDISLIRPHKLSYTTLYDVNYVLVQLQTDGGIEGLGEAATLGGPGWSEESEESIKITIDKYLAPQLIGEDPRQIESLRKKMKTAVRGNMFAKAAIEMSLFDVVGKAYGIPSYNLLGGLVRSEIPLSWTLAIGDPDKEIDDAKKMIEQNGHFIFKIKVGGEPAQQDVMRVKRIKEALGDQVSLRIDVNQGWDRATAVRAVKQLEECGLAFIEQPVPSWDIDGMSSVARSVSTPIMADESLATLHDATILVQKEAASVFGLKVTKAGGLLGCKQLASIAEGAGLNCYVGCMIETGIGTAAYLHLAASTPNVTYGCELFGPLLLKDDIVQEKTKYSKGHIVVTDKPGLGVTLDKEKLEKYTRKNTFTIIE